MPDAIIKDNKALIKDGKRCVASNCPCGVDCANACEGDTPTEIQVTLARNTPGIWTGPNGGDCSKSTVCPVDGTYVLTNAAADPDGFATISTSVGILGSAPTPGGNRTCILTDCLDCIWFYLFPAPTTCSSGKYYEYLVLTLCDSTTTMPCSGSPGWNWYLDLVSAGHDGTSTGARVGWRKLGVSGPCGSLNETFTLYQALNYGGSGTVCEWAYTGFGGLDHWQSVPVLAL